MFNARFKVLLLALAAACSPALLAAPSADQQLRLAVEELQSGRESSAYRTLEQLTLQQPRLPLAQAMMSELEARRSAGGLMPVANVTGPGGRLQELVEEAQLRLSPPKVPSGTVPTPILALSERHPYVIVVDLPRARLYVLANQKGRLTLVREHYAAMGRNGAGKHSKGDLRTPIGIYTVTGFTPDDQLPDLYGAGAFPLTYPNSWDRHNGRDGSGIWLHGIDRNLVSRSPRSSEGCVTMGNSDLVALKPFLVPGETPVILADSVQWLPPAQSNDLRDQLLAAIEDWRAKWSAIDTDGYLAYYADNFVSEGMSKTAFSAYKQRVNAGKKKIDVQLRDLDVLRYPGERDLVMVQFTQEYKSDNYAAVSFKQQFWRQQPGGSWKIELEESR